MSSPDSATWTHDVERVRQHALGELPRRAAQRTPDKTAIIAAASGDEVRLTFAEFDAVIDRAAAAIHDAGLTKGDRLLLLSHNCWQFAVLNFAAARVGVILVPVNFMLGAEDIAYIVDHSECAAVVVEDALVRVMDAALARAAHPVAIRQVLRLTGGEVADGWRDGQGWFDHDGTPPHVPVDDDDPIRIMYTSGTESRPKGAVLTSRSLMWQYVSAIVDGGKSADDIDLHALPLYHCAQLDVFLGPDVYLGATSVIIGSAEPGGVLAAIERYGVTNFFAPPTVWISLLRSPVRATTDLGSLRTACYGASPMPVEILRELGEALPAVAMRNMYGQTEVAPLATILQPDEQVAFAGSAGRPALNVSTAIVDDDGEILGPREVGEIVHRTPHAMLGYFRDEEKSAEAFRDGWFHSGDLGYFDETGHLYVVDRKKDMIKTGGENVSSREVEEALYVLSGVAEVAVIGLPHERWVEVVTAIVVAKPDSGLTTDAVLDHARESLSSFKRPKYVVLVEALPKNPSGKILKRRLREEFAHVAAG